MADITTRRQGEMLQMFLRVLAEKDATARVEHAMEAGIGRTS